jgi:hypothetical protein
MEGTDKVRFCGDCRLHVYNLSAMTRQEAQDLLREDGKVQCAYFYQRADGMMLIQDCPRGLAALAEKSKQGAAFLTRFVVVMCCLFIGLLMILGNQSGGSNSIWEMEPFHTIEAWAPWLRPQCSNTFSYIGNGGRIGSTGS